MRGEGREREGEKIANPFKNIMKCSCPKQTHLGNKLCGELAQHNGSSTRLGVNIL